MLLLLASADARAAETCSRPTDAAGYAGYAYGSAPALSFDEPHVRIWYVLEGRHRVAASSTRPDGVPDDVAHTAAVTEDALARYAAMGYRAPPTDEDTACGSNGGDGRLDVYLVDFTSADGTAVPERCTKRGDAHRCASFILAESNFAGRYPTADEGIRTVLPHEVFHAVQNGYDANMDRFWAEGTAQWAAETLAPSLTDLERFLPAFFREPSRALDVPPGSVTGAYLYGSAIWPVYLTQTHGEGIVRSILEAQGAGGASALAATDAVLRTTLKSSLASEYTRFAIWNAATGARAGQAGYRDAKDYPMVDLTDLPKGGARGILSGLGAFYYRLKLDSAMHIALDADPARVAAAVIPVEGATARIDRTVALSPGSIPAKVDGESILVVNGTTTSKVDAPFALTLSAPPPAKEPDPAPPAGATADGGGCSVSGRGEPAASFSPWAILLALALFSGARSRSSSAHEPSAKSEPRAKAASSPPARIVPVTGPGFMARRIRERRRLG
ncbi:MXAN_6640 family putative metalloprotease [Pendulispora albinea]